jgi:thiosulfate dehydrogenase [quinone] large subunit
LTRPSLPVLALLPVRFFFGATFLYAGIDKLVDPSFLDPTAATSLHAQLIAFARFSPLGGLLEAVLPFSVLVGIVIAVAEIGIGIGALSGLAFRLAAVGGFALSILLWLTASWATHPYYYGEDLPYAFGWLALAIAGHSDYLVPARFKAGWVPPTAAARGQDGLRTSVVQPGAVASPSRRLFLQGATLAGVSAIVATLAIPLRSEEAVTSRESPGPSVAPVPTAAPGATAGPNGVAVAKVADVRGAGAASFTIPFNAPAPLPAGDPGVIVLLADGTFAAFDATCTHAGCTVEWDQADRVLICPCHDAVFDPERGAAVVDGPAPTPLTSLPIMIDAATGTILLVSKAG